MTLTVEKIIGYTIAIVVLLFLVFGGGDAFANTKNAANKIISWLPDLSFGQKNLTASKPTVPETQQVEINKFKETLQKLMTSDKENCFVQFDGFSELPESVQLKLYHDDAVGGTVLTVSNKPGESTHEQMVSTFVIDKMYPCVIGGGSVYTQGFYHNYLDPGDSKENNWNGNQVFNAITQPILFNLDTTLVNENVINYGAGSVDFHGDHWLYKPDKTHICFFPTVNGNWACDGDSPEGLDDDCLTDETETTSLPYRVQHDSSLLCFGEFKSTAKAQPQSGQDASPTGIKKGTT